MTSETASPGYAEDDLLPYLAYTPDMDLTDSVRLGLLQMGEPPQFARLGLDAIRDEWNLVVVYYTAALSCAEGLARGEFL